MSTSALPSRSRLARGLSIALISAASAVALVPGAASAATEAIVTDSGCTTNSMGLNDDNSTGPIPLSSTLNYYDREVVSTVRVSNNGAFYLGESYNNWIAPFNTDLDSRFTGTPVTYGETTFGGRPALCANWLNIGYYAHGDTPTVDVQALLVDRSDLGPGDFDIVFNYGRIGGTPYGPSVGFFSYSETGSDSYVLPYSGVQGAFDDSNTETGLIHGSRESAVLGRYVFRFRDGLPVGIAPPNTTLSTQAESLSSDASPSFTYATSRPGAEHDRFECRVTAGDEVPGAFETCPDDGLTYDTMADGSYTFEVRAVDTYGNTDQTPASATFTIDTTGPDTQIDTTPAALSNDDTPTFTWSSEATDLASFECNLGRPEGAGEPSPWEDCDDEGETMPNLGDGEWTFQVRGVDDLGNVDPTPAAYDFVIDTEATGVIIVTGPDFVGNDSSPTFTYEADPADDVDHFECLVSAAGAQSGTPVPCEADGFTAESLADGDYRFGVSTVDLAGNASEPAVFDFRVDTIAPQTTVTTAPAAMVGTDSVTFGFASDDGQSTFECRLSAAGQSAAWQSCADASKTFSGLADGGYLFEVRATDAAGNTDATPATGTVKVNVARPTITASVSSEHPMSRFGWHRSAVTITYTCAGNDLVGACPAPRLVPRAQRGRTFKASIATADDDTASVSTTLYIDKGRPEATIKGFSGKVTYSKVPKSIRCVASDPRSGLDDCTVSVTQVKRKNGDRLIVVRAKATDRAGNVRVVTKKAPLRAA